MQVKIMNISNFLVNILQLNKQLEYFLSAVLRNVFHFNALHRFRYIDVIKYIKYCNKLEPEKGS